MRLGKIGGRDKKLTAAALAVGVGLVRGTTAMSGTGTIYNLGSLNPNLAQGMAINASGQVAGFGSSSSYGMVAFRSTGLPGSGGTESSLGLLVTGLPVYATVSEGLAINNSGQVAGYGFVNANNQNAFLYTGTPGSGGTMANLGTLGSGLNSRAFGINNSGEICGESTTTGSGTYYNAFAYLGTPGSGGQMYNLGTLGGNISFANAINSSGEIVGDSTTSASHYEAFVYTGTPGSGGKMVGLGTGALPGAGTTVANAVNASGQITGWANTNTGAQHAYRYSGAPGNNSAFLDLGTLGGNQSIGYGIDDAGDVVGQSELANDNLRPFLYTGTPGSGGKITDLNAWLDATNPTAGANWILLDATSINDSGLITGYGEYIGGGGFTNMPYILDASALLPEPGALSILGLASVGLLRRRARNRAV